MTMSNYHLRDPRLSHKAAGLWGCTSSASRFLFTVSIINITLDICFNTISDHIPTHTLNIEIGIRQYVRFLLNGHPLLLYSTD